jgi:hypothetical protein
VSDLLPRSYKQVHSIFSHILDCLVRDLNYGPWLVTLSWTDKLTSLKIEVGEEMSPKTSNKTVRKCPLSSHALCQCPLILNSSLFSSKTLITAES